MKYCIAFRDVESVIAVAHFCEKFLNLVSTDRWIEFEIDERSLMLLRIKHPDVWLHAYDSLDAMMKDRVQI